MRQFAIDPNVIVAESMVPSSNPFSRIFGKGSMRLNARIGKAKDKAKTKVTGISFFSPFLPLALPGVDPALFYDKAA